MNIENINTVRRMGMVKKTLIGTPRLTKSYKKVYVMTSHKIDPLLNGVICE
jgi:ribosomal protein L23